MEQPTIFRKFYGIPSDNEGEAKMGRENVFGIFDTASYNIVICLQKGGIYPAGCCYLLGFV
jgi:hypothetical protein